MITKAIIVETPLNNSNKFKIQIPTLIKANNNKDNFILDATLCYQPGVILGYNIGDVVFVAFEDNYIEKPIILGKLYKTDSLDTDVNSQIYNISYNLNVTNNCTLPASTNIDNLNILETIKLLKNRLEVIEEKLNNN